MCKVSIIVPIYNVEKYLRKCVDSLINQTLQDIEIILVNDASPDASDSIMREYQENYPHLIKCIYLKENVRLGGARNRGFEIAKGEYVSFVDSDDWVDLDYIEKLYNKAIETNSDIVYADYMIASDTKNETRPNMFPQFCGVQDDVRHKANLLMTGDGACACIIRRSLLYDNQLYFPEKMVYEDMAICPVFTYYANCLAHVEGSYYYYYQREDSITHAVDAEFQKEEAKAVLMLLEECDKRGITEKYPYEVEALFTKYFYAWGMYGIYYGKFTTPPKDYMKYLAEVMQKQFPEYRHNPYLYGNVEPNLIQNMFDNDEEWLIAKESTGQATISYVDFYQQSRVRQRLDNLMKLLRNKRVALWGAGKKGREFLSVLENKDAVSLVIDKNVKLTGTILDSGQAIVSPEEGVAKVDYILIINKNYYEGIKKEAKLRNKDVKVINMDLYLLFEFDVDECIE